MHADPATAPPDEPLGHDPECRFGKDFLYDRPAAAADARGLDPDRCARCRLLGTSL